MAAPSSGESAGTARQRVEQSAASVSPNSVGDQPTAKDTLGFEPYVKAVAAFLTHDHTAPPLTLSVEGAWGSGKSSFMMQLEREIKTKGGKTVWFNAWRHDKEDELWAAFALDFTKEMAAELPAWKRLLLHLKIAYLRFDWRRGWYEVTKFVVVAALFLFISLSAWKYYWDEPSLLGQVFSSARQAANGGKSEGLADIAVRLLLGIGGVAGYLVLGISLLRKVAEVVGNPLKTQLTNYVRDPKYESRAAFIETFQTDFARLAGTYAEGKRVFVFIDDLDRCDVPKAAELMQAINLLISDELALFYILGLDREKIAAGLAAKYEKLLPYLSSNKAINASTGAAGIEFGYTFLEKFIQIPFMVPVPANADIDKLLDSLGSGPKQTQPSEQSTKEIDPGLLVELSADSQSVRDIVKMVAPAFDYNPRRLKQFVNLFRLRALLASQTGLFGAPRDQFAPLTFEQLGKLVAIMLRWPLLFVDLETDRELLKDLQTVAWGQTKYEASKTPLFKYWEDKSNLLELIRFPAKVGSPPDSHEQMRYGLFAMDVDRFLQVSPPVVRRPAGVGPDGGSLRTSVAAGITANYESREVPQEQRKENPNQPAQFDPEFVAKAEFVAEKDRVRRQRGRAFAARPRADRDAEEEFPESESPRPDPSKPV